MASKSKFAGIVPNRRKVESPDHQHSSIPAIGRPRTGKRSNEDYRQMSVWIRKDTYAAVKRKLFLDENEREVSDLVQALFEDYLAEEPKHKPR